MNAQEKTEKLVEKGLKILEDLCVKFLFSGKEKMTYVCFDIPNSKYMAVIKVFRDYIETKKWRVGVGVMEEGTDKILEVYMEKLNNDIEVIEYLHKSETKTEILAQIIRLNEKAPDSLDF